MIDLSKNQNPYYPTKKIYRKLKKEVKSIKFYAEDYVKISLPKTFGNRRITERNFLITNGTMEAMDLILFVCNLHSGELKLQQIEILMK